MHDAVQLEGFTADTYETPLDDPTALNARPFKLRLLLNSLTSPHVFLCGDLHAYRDHATRAERACALLALRINSAPKLALADAVNALLSSQTGHSGIGWLGYHHHPHLYAVVRRGLAHLEHEHLVTLHHDQITRRDT